MKQMSLKWACGVFVAAAAVAIAPAYGSVESQKVVVAKAIQKVPVTELAAKAANLVAKAKAADRKDVAIASVQVILQQQPMVAAPLVGAISAVAPNLAAAVAAAAAEINPAQAVEIARAAASAAPDEGTAIVAAVSKAAPELAVRIAQVQPVPTVARSSRAAVAALGGPTLNPGTTPINPGAPGFDTRGTPNNVSGRDTFGADYARP
ncbi:MAG: hypothetical protein FJ387_01915 [Verrucomicrobia bacterium]|nr:hypothetical protein [Verrucomicrobiota bacterium]